VHAFSQAGHAPPFSSFTSGMYFATHFYFSSYHVFSNLVLRRVLSGFAPGPARKALFIFAVCAFAYLTAFMETLTISNFPYCAQNNK